MNERIMFFLIFIRNSPLVATQDNDYLPMCIYCLVDYTGIGEDGIIFYDESNGVQLCKHKRICPYLVFAQESIGLFAPEFHDYIKMGYVPVDRGEYANLGYIYKTFFSYDK